MLLAPAPKGAIIQMNFNIGLVSLGCAKNQTDAETMLSETRYLEAIALQEAGDYDSANKILKELGDYKDSKDKVNEIIYNQGIALFDDGEFAEAFDKFEKLGDYKDRKEKKANSLFYNFVIEGDFSGKNITIDIDAMKEAYNAKTLNGDEIKSIIVGSWLGRTSTPSEIMTFNEDGSATQKRYLAKQWRDNANSISWIVENDELKIKQTYTMNGETKDITENYKFISMSDDAIVAYNPTSQIIEKIYIAKGSELESICMEEYNMH